MFRWDPQNSYLMDNDQSDNLLSENKPLSRVVIFYAAMLFVAGAVSLYIAISIYGALNGEYGWDSAFLFLIFAIFTITMGYAWPGSGHVSFDRVAQISSILVLGPVDAAWINGLASLIYPWHRFWKGVPLRDVITASMYNAGMVVIVILSCGMLYVYLGGPIPLATLDIRIGGLLLLLMLSTQGLNDSLMALMIGLSGRNPSRLLSVFSIGVELTSGPLAILLAIVFVRLEMPIILLLIFAMALGMLVCKQFAEMRVKLEALVDERTEELRLKSLELERQATHDTLTGLFDRRYADDFLNKEIERSKRNDQPCTIALADIDHFKQINDQHSHAVGDRVLCRIAEIFVDHCRQTDVVARYGGEEFLLCFPDTDAVFAEQICSQIRTAIEKEDWSVIAAGIKTTVSFGIAEVGLDSLRTGVLSDADLRLYQAKNKGRNRVVGLR